MMSALFYSTLRRRFMIALNVSKILRTDARTVDVCKIIFVHGKKLGK